jgi:hypothetical protein
MTINAHDLGATVGQWNALVRRARIGREHKAAAFTVSSYADADGTGIFLSPARYAVDLEVSYSTARRYLTWLRGVGLLEMTRAGNRRRGTASEYRLIIGPDVLERIEVLSPDAQKALAEEMRGAEREGTRGRVAKMRASDQRSPNASVNEAPEEPETAPDQRSPKASVKEPINAQTEPDQRSPWMTYTPSPPTPSQEDHPPRADDEDLRTAVTGSRASTEPNPELPSPQPAKCSHGFKINARPDGSSSCAFCRREQAAGPPEPDPEPPPGRPSRCDHTPLPGNCHICPTERVAPVVRLDSRRTRTA